MFPFQTLHALGALRIGDAEGTRSLYIDLGALLASISALFGVRQP